MKFTCWLAVSKIFQCVKNQISFAVLWSIQIEAAIKEAEMYVTQSQLTSRLFCCSTRPEIRFTDATKVLQILHHGIHLYKKTNFGLLIKQDTHWKRVNEQAPKGFPDFRH